MRLFVSLGQSSVNELKFDRGPIYVGRQMGSQIFLPDKAVSRQHAVFYTTKDGVWVIEDLGSSNKTHVNSQVVHKTELNHNDIVRIADFLIRVSLEEDEDHERRTEMEDTIMGEHHIHRDLHTVERNLEALDAPPFKFPPKRIKQYHEVLATLSKQKKWNPSSNQRWMYCFGSSRPKTSGWVFAKIPPAQWISKTAESSQPNISNG
jgi:pSer/pThr/pTyr-binding forkhead associated (FHA) protein